MKDAPLPLSKGLEHLAKALSRPETRRLVQEYAEAVRKLEDEVKSLRSFKASVDAALNSGDGTYRP